ncbi:glycosyltransferase family 9 protein [Humidesulfovibrio idahonensis]
MANDPVLVLQMQRMGDLILSFPLMLWLSRCYPGRPIHIVAEDSFFRPLMPISPHVAYISWKDAATGALAGRHYRLVANLSIREEAARLAGSLDADIKVGPVREADGTLRVRGNWQLYRASLVGQGRHNRFHWADLNALDMVPLDALRLTNFDTPRTPEAGNDRIGLFVGASEPGKRPDAGFYAGLARGLLDRGLKPVLLGGPDDMPLAEAVRAESRLPLVNFVGRMTLSELIEYGKTLALMITPDTGPMHLAAWTGLPTLNISVGHVNPWDTGPYQPGHLVLRSTASCARGCWSCRWERCPCRAGLAPQPVAALAALVLRGPRARLGRVHLPGLELFESARTDLGLFTLRRLGPARQQNAADLAGEFWRCFFLWRIATQPPQPVEPVLAAWTALAGAYPRLARSAKSALPVLGRIVARQSRGGAAAPGALAEVRPFWRPLASYLEMTGQNADMAPGWTRSSLELLERLAVIVAG